MLVVFGSFDGNTGEVTGGDVTTTSGLFSGKMLVVFGSLDGITGEVTGGDVTSAWTGLADTGGGTDREMPGARSPVATWVGASSRE
jgi:hypothetical protein